MATSSQNTKPQPVLWTATVMTVLTSISGGLAALEIVPIKIVGLIVLIVASINLGVGFYVRGKVVPFVDTGAYLNDQGILVAGPASPRHVQNDTPVVVVSDSPTVEGGMV